VASPPSTDELQVLADRLLEAGDPRGEPLALQCALARLDPDDRLRDELCARLDKLPPSGHGPPAYKWALAHHALPETYGVSLSADGAELVVSHVEGVTWLAAETGEVRLSGEGISGSISADGKNMARILPGGALLVMEARDKRPLARLELDDEWWTRLPEGLGLGRRRHPRVQNILVEVGRPRAWTPNGISLWDEGWYEQWDFRGDLVAVGFINNIMATARRGGQVELGRHRLLDLGEEIGTACFSDERIVVTLPRRRRVEVYDIWSNLLYFVPTTGLPVDVDLSADGKLLAVADGSASVWIVG
jgi:hypothetical protein